MITHETYEKKPRKELTNHFLKVLYSFIYTKTNTAYMPNIVCELTFHFFVCSLADLNTAFHSFVSASIKNTMQEWPEWVSHAPFAIVHSYYVCTSQFHQLDTHYQRRWFVVRRRAILFQVRMLRSGLIKNSRPSNFSFFSLCLFFCLACLWSLLCRVISFVLSFIRLEHRNKWKIKFFWQRKWDNQFYSISLHHCFCAAQK